MPAAVTKIVQKDKFELSLQTSKQQAKHTRPWEAKEPSVE
jgi:hypothetical protein